MPQPENQTKEEIAAAALAELEAASGQSLPPDRAVLASYYVGAAYDELSEHRPGREGVQGYDPTKHAPSYARSAATAYVKARLAGQDPEASQTYLAKAQRWARRAAVRVSEEKEARREEEREAKTQPLLD